MMASTETPPDRPAYEPQFEERGIDPLPVAATAVVKISAARRPPDPPTDAGPKVILPPGAGHE
jgi:hypothetical protein